MKTAVIRKNLMVREDGAVRNVSGHWNSKGWHYGNLDANGYPRVSVPHTKRWIHIHRLVAEAFIDGKLANYEVDHIDGNRANNHVTNLRWVSCRDNQNNLQKHRDGKLVGATLHKGKWDARICVAGKSVYLGSFATMEEAHTVYQAHKLIITGTFK